MITIVWEYLVKTDCIAKFEKVYAPNGKWAKLFKKGKGYIRTKLIRTPEDSNRFITVDEWETLEEYKAFLSQWKEDYESLDKQCEGLTEHESYLGTFGAGFNDQQWRLSK
jgi:heme-degrading monooxygenase HmoA